jgi:uncharacterized protein (TIGR02117 family)
MATIVAICVAAFWGLYFGAAWRCSRIAVAGENDGPREITLYIKSNGAHTDIVMPVREPLTGVDWSRRVDMTHTVSRDTTFSHIALGWGDRAFFLDMPTWDDLTSRLAFNAAFALNTTAMHATFYHERELGQGALCRRLSVSEQQYLRLAEFVEKRFARDGAGNFFPIATTAQYGANDCFYVARGRYNLFYTCNTWANCALAAAGQRRCLWTIFDEPIFRLYE